jgi:hypothetical protein
MQGIWNQMVRWVFWLAVEWPMKIARMPYRGSEGTATFAVKGAQAGRATQDTAEDEPVAPMSRQGQKDRKDYALILDAFEGHLIELEDMAALSEPVREIVVFPDDYPQSDVERARRALREGEETLSRKSYELSLQELRGRRVQLEARLNGLIEAS